MTERVAGAFGAPATIDPHVFRVTIPAAARASVSIVEDFGLQGGTNGVPEQVERCSLPRAAWTTIRDAAARALNERLKEKKLPTGSWRTGENVVDRLLGKELCVLAWAVEAAPASTVPIALHNWAALRPEERWWLFAMAAATVGSVDDRDVGWRKAIRIALTETTHDAAPKPRRADHSSDTAEKQQIALFMQEREHG